MASIIDRVIRNDRVSLQTRIYKPDRISGEFVVCLVHPWGFLGGSWENTKGLAHGFCSEGFVAVAFNLRGVGESTGSGSLCGHSEVSDVVTVCEWAYAEYGKRVWIVAQSAGAATAGSAAARADQSAIAGAIFIGYTFGCATSILFGRHYTKILRWPKPQLYIMGTRDCFTTRSTLLRKLRSRPAASELLFLDVGHFEIESELYEDRVLEACLCFIRDGNTGLQGLRDPAAYERTMCGSICGCWDFCTSCVTCLLVVIGAIVGIVTAASQDAL